MREKALPTVVLVLIGISLFFLGPLFRPGFYVSHDGENHVARFGAYYKAFKDGQIPPRFAADLNFGYGTPLLTFFYPLPGYIASLMHSFGISLEDAFKLLMALSFILAPLFFFLWMQEVFPTSIAFLSAVMYALLPYRFLDLYIRGDIGEMLSFVFIPLTLLMVEKNMKKPSICFILLGATFYSLLVLSHNIISLIFSPVLVSYIIVKGFHNTRMIMINGAMLLLGLLLSTFFWLPALYEAKFINSALFIGGMFKEHFPTIQQLIYSPWGFGPDVAKEGGLSPQIGPSHLLVAFLSVVSLLRMKREKMFSTFWLFIFGLGVFMELPLSEGVWERLPFLDQFQFPWRFTALSSFAAAVLTPYGLSPFKKNRLLLLFVIGATLLFALQYVKVSEYLSKPNSYYFSFPGTTYYHGEATTIWTAGDAGKLPKEPIEIFAGQGEIKNIYRKSNNHRFDVQAQTEVKVVDNTVYFPGWQVFVDEQKTKIEFQDINNRGLITFAVPKGTHNVEVRFGESPIRLLSNTISVSTFVFVLGLLLLRERLDKVFGRS